MSTIVVVVVFFSPDMHMFMRGCIRRLHSNWCTAHICTQHGRDVKKMRQRKRKKKLPPYKGQIVIENDIRQ